MWLAAARARLREALFVPDAQPPDPVASRETVTRWLALFIVSRVLVLAIYHLRHMAFEGSDPTNYLALARFIQSHGHLPADAFIGRQFPGLPFLIVAADHVFHDLTVSGYVVAWGGALASVALFHATWRSDRLTAIYTIFVPGWVSASSRIMSEGCTLALFLVAILALTRATGWRQLLLLVVAGYAIVVRNTAIVFLLPLVIAWSLARPRATAKQLALRLLAVLLPVAIYLAYNEATIGLLLPQVSSARRYLATASGGHYPPSLLTWPGHSLLLGLTQPGENVFKRLSVLASLGLIAFAVRELLRRRPGDSPGASRLAFALGVGTAAHLAFHLCVGGSFGYSSFDRYVSHVNPALVIGLFGTRRLRWPCIVALAVVGVTFAGLTGTPPPPVSLESS
jgi:hypothetical protein